MAYEECKRCGAKYNLDTISRCPACSKQNLGKGSRTTGEIQRYIREDIGKKKRIVNSFRRAEVSKWEREHGAQIY